MTDIHKWYLYYSMMNITHETPDFSRSLHKLITQVNCRLSHKSQVMQEGIFSFM